MQLAQKLGGYSLGEADLMRRAMGKKKREEMALHEEKFIAGCTKNKIQKKKAKEIFRLMAQFADYGFNRSHSVAYAYVAYQTAYLKAHYPEHFYAAVMTYVTDDAAKIFKYASELRAQGIKMLPPDVNESYSGFTPVAGAIRYGLTAIKGLGQSAVAAVIDARAARPFTSIFDFASRVGEKGAGKRVMESLVCAGAFDSLKPAGETLQLWRARLHATVDRALERGARERKARDRGQADMFGAAFGANDTQGSDEQPCPPEQVTEWTHKQMLSHEKAAVGFYVSGHPLEAYAEKIEQLNCTSITELSDVEPNSRVRVAGMVSDFTVRTTKKGDAYAFFRLEDVTGAGIKCVLWPEAFKTKDKETANDAALLAVGRLDGGSETSLSIICDEVALLDRAKIPTHQTWTTRRNGKSVPQAVALEFPPDADAAKLGEAVIEMLIANPGECEVFIDVPLGAPGGHVVRAKAARFIKVHPSQTLKDDLLAKGIHVKLIDVTPTA
jgi:DNA polymerase-3 subunit alpha